MTGHEVTEAVVLARRRTGEWDRVADLYTRRFGRIAARLGGVERPAAKLKALSEPMVAGEYRLFLRPSAPWATVTGGRVTECFPGIRADLGLVMQGLEMCEMLRAVSAEGSPRPEKLDLLLDHLRALDRGGSPWPLVSFGANLLGLSGVGLAPDRLSPEDRDFWARLFEIPPRSLHALAPSPGRAARLRAVVEGAVEGYAERPLRSRQFRQALDSFTRRLAGAATDPAGTLA